MWIGETPKDVAAVFRIATEEDAVLFFDKADAVAARRSTGTTQGHQRESNTVVSVLLKELEIFNGVVIFATNLAVNLRPGVRATDPDARGVRDAGSRRTRKERHAAVTVWRH